jgi:ATP-binding cassette subfamily B protein
MDPATSTGDFRDAYLVQAAAFDAAIPSQSAGDHDTLRAQDHA